MIAHVILFRPKPELTSSRPRGHSSRALTSAASDVAGVRRFRIGRRIRHGLPGYEQAMREDFEFVVIMSGRRRRCAEGVSCGTIARRAGQPLLAISGCRAYDDYELVDASEGEDALEGLRVGFGGFATCHQNLHRRTQRREEKRGTENFLTVSEQLAPRVARLGQVRAGTGNETRRIQTVPRSRACSNPDRSALRRASLEAVSTNSVPLPPPVLPFSCNAFIGGQQPARPKFYPRLPTLRSSEEFLDDLSQLGDALRRIDGDPQVWSRCRGPSCAGVQRAQLVDDPSLAPARGITSRGPSPGATCLKPCASSTRSATRRSM